MYPINKKMSAVAPKAETMEQNQPQRLVFRRPSSQLLLPAAYRINTSCSKIAHVGYAWNKGSPELVIEITDAHHKGVTFTATSWDNFCRDVQFIMRYLDNSETHDVDTIEHVDYKIHFTTSYSDRAIILEQVLLEDDESQQDSQIMASPNIVLKKVSFDGLVELIPAIRSRLMYLTLHKTMIYECIQAMKDFIKEKFQANSAFANMSSKDLKKFITCMYKNDLTIYVLARLSDDNTVHELKNELVLNEITALYFDYIIYLVRTTPF